MPKRYYLPTIFGCSLMKEATFKPLVMARVFLVDDHVVFREGLRLLLASEANLEVAAEAGDGAQLRALLPTTPTEVVLLSWNTLASDGLETARYLQLHHPAVRVMVLGILHDEEAVCQMVSSGVAGYALKKSELVEIVHGIRTVAAGRFFLSSELGLQFITKWCSSPKLPYQVSPTVLSSREMDVLQLIAQGLRTAEIADKLFISVRTVETHRQNILEKTQVKNTAALIRYALGAGLIR